MPVSTSVPTTTRPQATGAQPGGSIVPQSAGHGPIVTYPHVQPALTTTTGSGLGEGFTLVQREVARSIHDIKQDMNQHVEDLKSKISTLEQENRGMKQEIVELRDELKAFKRKACEEVLGVMAPLGRAPLCQKPAVHSFDYMCVSTLLAHIDVKSVD